MTTPPPQCVPCPPSGAAAGILFCDTAVGGGVTQFVRLYLLNGTTIDVDVDGGSYTVTGTAAPCDAATGGCDVPIALSNLCLADGTPIAVIVQRDCDGTVTAPSWINLTTGAVTAGLVPADAAPCDATVTCASPTTPMTTTGLCLPDGTPIATIASRDCDGVVTQSGWLNLQTGAYTAGLPPAGAIACGSAQSIQVAGVFCDTDPGTGDVFALVLVEYHYDEDGAIDSVRLVLAADGTTYVLQGELTICAAGGGAAMDIETQVLCLSDAAGTLIQQVTAEFGYDSTTGTRLFTRFTDPTTGAAVAPPVGSTIAACESLTPASTTVLLRCDNEELLLVKTPFLHHYVYAADGTTVVSHFLTDLNGAPYTLQGEEIDCANFAAQITSHLFCDDLGPFIKVYALFPPTDPNNPDLAEQYALSYELTLEGTAYDAQSAYGPCGQPATVTAVMLCDFDLLGNVLNQFMRVTVYNTDGTFGSTFDTDMTGAPYTPGGTVAECEHFDWVPNAQLLCDDLGPFIRIYNMRPDLSEFAEVMALYNRVVDVRMDGTAYAATGTVHDCGCNGPVTLAELCYTTPSVIANNVPSAVTSLVMTGAFLGDAAGEDICQVAPAPSLTQGLEFSGGCYRPVATTSPQMIWPGPVQAVTMEYGDAASTDPAGTSLVSYSSQETGPVTWPVNVTPMTIGEVRTSDTSNGRFATLTYVSGPTNGNGPLMNGGADIAVHTANGADDLPIRWRIEFFGPETFDGPISRVTLIRDCVGGVSAVDAFTGAPVDLETVTIVPCPTASDTVLVLCDDAGGFLRRITYDSSGTQIHNDTTLDGILYAPVGAVRSCADTVAADGPVATGIRRLTGDTAPVLLATEFPGLQSVTLTVITGVVNVSMTNGTAQAIPTGVSLSWSVSDADDSALTLATFDGLAGSDYLLVWTYKPTANG